MVAAAEKVMDKKELRKRLRITSGSLSECYKKEAGRLVAKNVTELPLFKKSKTLFIYVSTQSEPATREIIAEAWAQGKAVYVPKCLPENRMQAVRINSFDELHEGAWGIYEPEASDSQSHDSFDIAVIPCVSAWTDGRRLGHGAGYYDRFLEKCDAVKICLCFEKMLCDEIPVSEHDVYMDYVITEEHINEIKRNRH